MEDYKTYKVPEVCKILKITKQCLYKWIKEGKVKPIRFAGITRISEKELERILSGGTELEANR